MVSLRGIEKEICMKKFSVLALLMLLMVFGYSCSDDDDGGQAGSTAGYTNATAVVDYSGAYNVVFFDFSSGTVTTKNHKSWDIAIDCADTTKMVANSGDYGNGVYVAETNGAFGGDYSGVSIDGTVFSQYTFETNNILNAFQTSGNVYLVLDHDGTLFQIQYVEKTATAVTIRKADADGSNPVTNVINIDVAYDYAYVDLSDSGTGQVTVAPPKADWDIKFSRGNYHTPGHGGSYSGGSCIFLNVASGVQAGVVESVNITAVTDVSGVTFSGSVDAIGKDWYSYTGMPPTYSQEVETWVVRTAEGNYAKFQISSWYGPSDEKFYCDFVYMYNDAGGANFAN